MISLQFSLPWPHGSPAHPKPFGQLPLLFLERSSSGCPPGACPHLLLVSAPKSPPQGSLPCFASQQSSYPSLTHHTCHLLTYFSSPHPAGLLEAGARPRDLLLTTAPQGRKWLLPHRHPALPDKRPPAWTAVWPQPCAREPPVASPRSSGVDSLQLEPMLPAVCSPASLAGGRQLLTEGAGV